MKRFQSMILATALLGLGTVAQAQSDLLPNGQYPQFRTLSGLPGGGFGLLSDGTPSFSGAMAFSTPIGYSLSNNHVSFNLANTSDNLFFRLPHVAGNSGNTDSLGKANGMFGQSLGNFGSLTVAVVLDSSVGDRNYNFQYQAPNFIANLGLSAGVQDLVGHRGTGAVGVPGGNGYSQSVFFAATYQLPHGIYASLGDGNRRFSKGFANVSAPLVPRVKAVLEHDGFNFNEAMAYDLGELKFLHIGTRIAQSSLMVGLVKSQYAFFSLNVSL